MNPLDMIDVEIEANRVGDYYEIGIDAGDFGEAEIRVKAWAMDAALDEAEGAVDEAAEAYRELFNDLKEELHD